MTTLATILVLTVFPILVTYAAISDIRTLRIPNWLNLAIAGSFFPVALIAGMPLEVMVWHLAAFGAAFALGFTIFALNLFGGGDAKMIPAAAIWLGWGDGGEYMITFFIMTSLAGGLLAIISFIWRKLTVEVGVWASEGAGQKMLEKKPDLPYGVAIAAGALITYPQTWWSPFILGS